MVTTVAPIAIVAGSVVTVVLLLTSAWETWGNWLLTRIKRSTDLFSRAGVSARPEEIFISALGGAAIVWIVLIMLLRPALIVAIALLGAFQAAAAASVYTWAYVRCERRLRAFVQQLELALRLVGSSLRVGLGLRQALALSVQELPEPARHEFARVVGQTNIGISTFDALDALAQRMPSNESLMMARAIRIQAQTGGNLAKVLEHLANTIRERRRLDRKRHAITAEGRLSAIVLCLIPVLLGVFIVTTQVRMGRALLFTPTGHGALVAVLVLELLGVGALRLILRTVS